MCDANFTPGRMGDLMTLLGETKREPGRSWTSWSVLQMRSRSRNETECEMQIAELQMGLLCCDCVLSGVREVWSGMERRASQHRSVSQNVG